MAVIDGRHLIVEEVEQADSALRTFIGNALQRFFGRAEFMDALPGFLLPDSANQGRVRIVMERLQQLISISKVK